VPFTLGDNVKRFGFLIVAFGMLGLNACGGTDLEGTCESQCSDAACNNGTTPTSAEITTCKSNCQAEEKALEQTGCKDDAQKFADCAGDAATSCSATASEQEAAAAKCSAQETNIAACIKKYCDANTSSTNELCAVEGSSN
jgi:hypothetical protein